MDSLTQIILGAACGEAVLGNKIGNKALLFGAIGGTIPDLDVFIGSLFYGNEIDAMLFHRGFMHSILFSVLAALAFGWITYKLYNSGKRVNSTELKDWVLLFFLSLFTHPILDCFTPYGTQLFAPFSNYRVAFNNIAVADPFYTLPFLICIIVVMLYKRTHINRKKWLHYGLIISSVYMLFTVCNKLYIDYLFRETLHDKQIEVSRFSSQPTILNNFLWYAIAETETDYYVGYYSLFDKTNRFTNWNKIPKKRIIDLEKFPDLEVLTWFSNDYYNVIQVDENNYEYLDLRYPFLNPDDLTSALFKLKIYKDKSRLNMKVFKPETDKMDGFIGQLTKRIFNN
jgi:inner membrane protein